MSVLVTPVSAASTYQHRLRIRQQVERQLRLGAEGVEAGRVENHQAVFEQQVRQVDDGMAPARDLDQAVIGDAHAELRSSSAMCSPSVCASSRGTCLTSANAPAPAPWPRTSGGRAARSAIPREVAVLGDRGAGLARLDRQQLSTGSVPASYSSSVGHMVVRPALEGSSAGAEVGEEDGVDEFGLAAREFGDEGDVELVVAQQRQHMFEALVDLGVAPGPGFAPRHAGRRSRRTAFRARRCRPRHVAPDDRFSGNPRQSYSVIYGLCKTGFWGGREALRDTRPCALWCRTILTKSICPGAPSPALAGLMLAAGQKKAERWPSRRSRTGSGRSCRRARAPVDLEPLLEIPGVVVGPAEIAQGGAAGADGTRQAWCG